MKRTTTAELKKTIAELMESNARLREDAIKASAHIKHLSVPREEKYQILIQGGSKTRADFKLDNITIHAAIEVTEIVLIKMRSSLRTAIAQL